MRSPVERGSFVCFFLPLMLFVLKKGAFVSERRIRTSWVGESTAVPSSEAFRIEGETVVSLDAACRPFLLVPRALYASRNHARTLIASRTALDTAASCQFRDVVEGGVASTNHAGPGVTDCGRIRPENTVGVPEVRVTTGGELG